MENIKNLSNLKGLELDFTYNRFGKNELGFKYFMGKLQELVNLRYLNLGLHKNYLGDIGNNMRYLRDSLNKLRNL